jgi:hypothetical protein
MKDIRLWIVLVFTGYLQGIVEDRVPASSGIFAVGECHVSFVLICEERMV